jgi:hypothetical protein
MEKGECLHSPQGGGGVGLTIDPEIGRVVRGLVAAVAVLPPYLHGVFNVDEEDILYYSGCQALAGS